MHTQGDRAVVHLINCDEVIFRLTSMLEELKQRKFSC